MAEVKWIKLCTGMFDNSKIKYLRTLPEGNNIVLIWVMLLAKAGKCNSNGYVFLTESIPYTNDMLAAEFGFDINTIILALGSLGKLGMIQQEEQKILINGWSEHQNIEGLEKIREQTRKRVAKTREKQKALDTKKDGNATCNATVTQCNETDKEEDIDKEYIYIEEIWSLYPNKKGKATAVKKIPKLLKKHSKEELIRCIDRYKEEIKNTKAEFILYGSTFFNGRFEDYLDANYKTEEKTKSDLEKMML